MDFSVRKIAGPCQLETAAPNACIPNKFKFNEEDQSQEYAFPKRKVHCYQPISQNAPQALQTASADDRQSMKRIPSLPMAIPGAELPDSNSSLIKAFSASKEPFHGRRLEPLDPARFTSAITVSPPKGSWTQRQIQFDPEDLPAKATARTVTSHVTKNGTITVNKPAKEIPKKAPVEDSTAEHIAWQYRFKKKWIREELHARKQDFPDDPGYEDLWEDAGDFIVKNGYKAAMQAAFMGATRDETNTEAQEIDPEDLSFDDGTFEVEGMGDNSAEMLARAAKLIHMTQKAQAVRV